MFKGYRHHCKSPGLNSASGSLLHVIPPLSLSPSLPVTLQLPYQIKVLKSPKRFLKKVLGHYPDDLML